MQFCEFLLRKSPANPNSRTRLSDVLHTKAYAFAWPTTSTQVINECSHVLRRKLKISPVQVAEEMESVIDAVQLVDVGLHEIRNAWTLAARHAGLGRNSHASFDLPVSYHESASGAIQTDVEELKTLYGTDFHQ